jgi:putative ABC transport system permease protein
MPLVRETVGALLAGLTGRRARPHHLALIATGYAVASITLISLLAIPAGIDALGGATGSNRVAIVLAASAQDEAASQIEPELAALIDGLPGVARDADGRPATAPQFIASTKLRRQDGQWSTIQVRGMTPATLAMLDEPLRQTAGTWFARGIDELVAGIGVARGLDALEPGATMKLRSLPWRVSGQFEGGGLWESELWTDIAPLQAAFNAQGKISVVWVKLDSPAAFAIFKTALNTDKRLRALRTEPQQAYYAQQLGLLAHFARVAAIAISVTLGLGAALAISNALAIALRARRREIGVFRALGFGRAALQLALLIEVLALGAWVTSAALAIAWLALDGREVDSSTGSQAFRFAIEVTPAVAASAFAYSLALGLAGALWPVRAVVRAPLLNALQVD